MNRRLAYTLIELLVVLSVGGVVMSLAITVLERTLAITTATTESLSDERAANRLVEQFRRDVHNAESVNVESPQRLIASNHSESVIYSVTDGNVVRDQTFKDGKMGHEEFFVGWNRTVEFVDRTDPKWASLAVKRDTGLKGYPIQIDRMVVATTGKMNPEPSQ